MSNLLSRFLWWLMKPWVLIILLLAIAAPAAAQVSGPSFVFVAGTIINPDEVNSNFTDIYDAALNRFGGTVEGHLLWSPDGTFDIGASGTSRPRDLFLQRDATIGGGLTANAIATVGTMTVGSTLAVTGATTLSAALGGTSATFSGTVTGNLFSGSGASLTSIPESAITDGAILARVGSAETISGLWAFGNTGTTTFAGSVTLANTRGLYIDNSVGTDIRVAEITASNQLNIGTDDSSGMNNTVLSAGQGIRFRTNSAERTFIDAAGTLTHAYALALTGVISPAALASGNNNDYAPTGFSTAYVVRLTANAGGSTLTGLAGGAAGRDIVLCHVGGGTITIPAEDGLSSAANRFVFSTNLSGGSCSRFIYDGTSARWRFVN